MATSTLRLGKTFHASALASAGGAMGMAVNVQREPDGAVRAALRCHYGSRLAGLVEWCHVVGYVCGCQSFGNGLWRTPRLTFRTIFLDLQPRNCSQTTLFNLIPMDMPALAATAVKLGVGTVATGYSNKSGATPDFGRYSPPQGGARQVDAEKTQKVIAEYTLWVQRREDRELVDSFEKREREREEREKRKSEEDAARAASNEESQAGAHHRLMELEAVDHGNTMQLLATAAVNQAATANAVCVVRAADEARAQADHSRELQL
ncbi:hypothetical protein BDK51DRAFT_52103 [Blyttiomyces helicus]|uniref:Uncharacterized protein n=1 Tax=Blyttiomyces helicus TaxID=388810 RepID=A0A4P9WF94_9FUNG|nr:hypothetical protein BDK51DRAFT_52103 [Blyttiomyces helicus]|eukprot:RKO90505.1 hypothetical protein BDK51DRAFT_52103 [Blyttiomyces helicus]